MELTNKTETTSLKDMKPTYMNLFQTFYLHNANLEKFIHESFDNKMFSIINQELEIITKLFNNMIKNSLYFNLDLNELKLKTILTNDEDGLKIEFNSNNNLSEKEMFDFNKAYSFYILAF